MNSPPISSMCLSRAMTIMNARARICGAPSKRCWGRSVHQRRRRLEEAPTARGGHRPQTPRSRVRRDEWKTPALALAEEWSELGGETEIELTSEMAKLTAVIIARAVFGRNQPRVGRAGDHRLHPPISAPPIPSTSGTFWVGMRVGGQRAVADGARPSKGPRGNRWRDQRPSLRRGRRRLDGRSADPPQPAHTGLDLDVTALRNEAATIFMPAMRRPPRR